MDVAQRNVSSLLFIKQVISALLLTIMMSPVGSPAAESEWPYFYPDDPLQVDRDDLETPEPAEVELSQYYDFMENTFLHPAGEEDPGALNINTLDEVPNSSWFTNRHGKSHMSPEELLKGPKTGSGPDMNVPLTVIRVTAEGITPGFLIRDSRGDVYFIKIDPKGFEEMSTTSEAICTLFFYAIGFNVPENYLLDIDTERLAVGGEAGIKDKLGVKRRMTDEDLEFILSKAPVRPDGTLRVIASKDIAGHSLGHFRYYGTRPDNANDIIPHQHRRELRGLRLFAAWLNHDDARSINSLDVYTEEGYVRHYLIDFGSCLGSGSVRPQTLRAGNEYMWEPGPTFKTMGTLGIWTRPYLRIPYPDFPSIGRFESEAFRPELWRPEYPNPAFDLMDDRDAFWAAKIVMSFTDAEVEKIVRAGKLSDPEAEDYMVKTLIARRDKIGRSYLNRTNPLDGFEIDGNTIRFSNLSVKYGFGRAPVGYLISWWKYDNEERRPSERLWDQKTVSGNDIQLPPVLDGL